MPRITNRSIVVAVTIYLAWVAVLSWLCLSGCAALGIGDFDRCDPWAVEQSVMLDYAGGRCASRALKAYSMLSKCENISGLKMTYVKYARVPWTHVYLQGENDGKPFQIFE